MIIATSHLVPIVRLLLLGATLTSLLNPGVLTAQSVSIEAVRTCSVTPATYVLLSGMMGGTATFRRLGAILEQHGHRVIAIDPYRISADSIDVSFSALARRVDRALASTVPVRLVGHSHGGGVALRVAALYPQRVKALYLLDVGALPSQKSRVFSASLKLAPLVAKLPGGKSFIRTRIVRGLRQNSGHTAWLDPETIQVYTAPYLADIDRVVKLALRLGRAEEPVSLATILFSVKAPIMVLLGDAPHMSAPVPGEVEALSQSGAEPRIEHMPGLGHFIHEEAPSHVASFLAPCIGSVVSTRAAVSLPQPRSR